jgi:hypothetical protein
VCVGPIHLYFLKHSELDLKLLPDLCYEILLLLGLNSPKLVTWKCHDLQTMISILLIQFIQQFIVILSHTTLTGHIDYKECASILVNVKIYSPTGDIVGLKVEKSYLGIGLEVLVL